MLKSWKFWTVMAVIGGLVVLFAVGFGLDPYTVQSPLIGQPAPRFTVTGLNKDEVVSLDSLKGKPLVLNFWGSWCVACREEAHVLQQSYEAFDLGTHQVKVVGIAMNDSPEKALAFAKAFGKTYFLALDTPQGDIAISYGVYGAPETFFIDGQGIIRAKWIGPVSFDRVKQQVEKLTAP